MKTGSAFKKFFATFFISLLCLSSAGYLIYPKKTEATVSVIDATVAGLVTGSNTFLDTIATEGAQTVKNTAANAATSVKILAETAMSSIQNAITATALDWYVWAKEFSLDGVLFYASKLLMIKLTQMMMNYVMTGLLGGPSYVQDYGSYYAGVSNNASQVYFNELRSFRNSFNPMSLTYMLLDRTEKQLEMQAYNPYVSYLQPTTQFPGNVNDYEAYATDFNSCPTGNGWDCWLAMRDPANDPYELMDRQHAELMKRTSESVSNASAEIMAAQGFHALKQCLPGASFNSGGFDYCKQYLTQLPGQIIVGQLQKYLQSQMDALGEADEFNEVIASVLVNFATSWMTNSSLQDPSITLPSYPTVQMNSTNPAYGVTPFGTNASNPFMGSTTKAIGPKPH